VIPVELKSKAADKIAFTKSLYDAFGKTDIPAALSGMDYSIFWNEAENILMLIRILMLIKTLS
jgi:hypothetical protein